MHQKNVDIKNRLQIRLARELEDTWIMLLLLLLKFLIEREEEGRQK